MKNKHAVGYHRLNGRHTWISTSDSKLTDLHYSADSSFVGPMTALSYTRLP